MRSLLQHGVGACALFLGLGSLWLGGAEDARGRKDGRLDRIEREDEAFQTVVAEGYRTLADLYPDRVTLLDGALAPQAIAEQVRGQVRVD